MQIIRKIFLIFFLCVLLMYVTNITSIPSSMALFEGEKYSLETIFGIFQKREKIIATSFNTNDDNVISEETIHLSFFNLFDVKDVNITVIKNTKVIPLRKYNRFKAIF